MPQPIPNRLMRHLSSWTLVLGLSFATALHQVSAAAAPDPVPTGALLPDYAAWRAACLKVPANRVLGERLPPRDRLPLARYSDFAAVLGPFLENCRTGDLARPDAWIDGPPDARTFFNLASAYYLQRGVPFQPFAQRHLVPPGTRLFVHGDLHGDIHSLIAYLDLLNRDGHLDGFRLAAPETRLLFLGDYTDRGRYGVEVMYTLMRLKLANPDRVLLVRGNHEDVSLVARYGFLAEATGKYGREFEIPRVARIYDFLPTVLYLACGTNVVQCNHGGLEPGFDPGRLLAAPETVSYQLLGRLNQRRLLEAKPAWVARLPAANRRELEGSLLDFVPESPTTPSVLGFMWNDFTVVAGEPQFAIDTGRAFVYGDEATRTVLDSASSQGFRVRAILRGHQHAGVLNPMMRRLIASWGVFRHWQASDALNRLEAAPDILANSLETAPVRALPDGSVWTFNVSPDSVYGAGCGFHFDTAGELVSADRWEDWRLRVLNVNVPASP
ncbi:MAG: serine/threonine protein phosphatase [Verrucomicrobiales bacterium]|nr:serine/threonine protein phosphatase [Verrucomicrobiales bacterium]